MRAEGGGGDVGERGGDVVVEGVERVGGEGGVGFLCVWEFVRGWVCW